MAVNRLEDRITPVNFEVSTLASDNSAGSLRAAIEAANAASGADTITFSALFNTAQTIPVGGTELLISDDLTITGPGATGTVPILSIDGGNMSRVFNVTNAGALLNVTLSGLRITGGRTNSAGTAGDGAGIFIDDDNVTLDRVQLTGNSAGPGTTSSGGAITVQDVNPAGVLTIRNSTISGNTSVGVGGAIYFYTGGSLVVENSTISGNSSTLAGGGGGAIYFFGAVGAGGFTITNSTVTANSTTNGSGGAIVLRSFNGTALIQNSTFANNMSGATSTAAGAGGGAIAIASGTAASILTLFSSIVSGNTAAAVNGRSDLSAITAATVNAYNSAIGDADGHTLSGASANNLPAGSFLGLLPLASNGGPTATIGLALGSPAVGAGANQAGLTTDQRGLGFPRLVGTAVDIGAFEGTVDSPTATGGPFATVTTLGVANYTFDVIYSGATAINVLTLDNNDVRVTGPNGFNALATFVTVNPPGNGSPRTATYRIDAPGGSFDVTENGAYTIAVEPNQVFNTSNTAVPNTTIGIFQVIVPGIQTVTTDADSGAGSLREVITLANATSNPDIIGFDPAFFGATPRTITLLTQLPDVTNPITLNGPGAALLTVRRDPAAATSFRIFSFFGTTYSATLAGLTITGGATVGTIGVFRSGGGIYINSSKNLTLVDSVLTGNSAAGTGGGIYVGSSATLTVRNSTISGNVAGTEPANTFRIGGGIYTRAGGTVSIENSTITGNSSPTIGGGLYLYANVTPGNWTIRNSTIANNTAPIGAGISTTMFGGAHTLRIENSTITGNTASTEGGGLFLGGTAPASLTTTIASTVIAFNTAPSGPDLAGAGSATVSNSLIRDQSAGTIIDGGNNLAAGIDPLFVGGATPTLANNGGPTQTVALQATSPLVNAGVNTLPPLQFDQRGSPFVRAVGGVDIGAFEVQGAVAPTVQSVQVNGGAAQRSRVTTLAVTFSTQVTFAGAVASAFTLTRTGGGAVSFAASANVVGGVTVVTLNGFTGAEADSGSLRDGRYTLTVLANQVSAGGTNMASNFTFGDAQGLFRFYGDMNADRRVDISDFGFFSLAYLTPANYNAALDFNNDGRIDIADFGQFSVRYFTTLP